MYFLPYPKPRYPKNCPIIAFCRFPKKIDESGGTLEGESGFEKAALWSTSVREESWLGFTHGREHEGRLLEHERWVKKNPPVDRVSTWEMDDKWWARFHFFSDNKYIFYWSMDQSNIVECCRQLWRIALSHPSSLLLSLFQSCRDSKAREW